MPSFSPAARVFLLMEGARAFCYALIFTASALFQIHVVGLSPLQLVLCGTVLEGTYFLFQIPTGVVADVYSRRLSIIIGFIGTGLAFVLEGLVPTFAGAIAANLAWGIAVTFIDGALEAWIADEVGPQEAERVFFRSGQLGGALGIAGILASTLLARWLALAVPIVLGGAGITLMGLLLIAIMPEKNFARKTGVGQNPFVAMATTARSGLRLVRGNRMLLLMTFIALFNGLWSEGLDRLWSKHLVETHNLSQFSATFAGVVVGEIEFFGALRIVSALLGITVVEWMQRRLNLADNARTARMLFWLTLALAAGVMVFALAPWLYLAVAGYLFSDMLRSPIVTARIAWINRQIGEGDSGVRATVLSMWSQADAIGQVAGGPALGAIGNGSLRVALALAALLIGAKLPFYRAARAQSADPAGTGTQNTSEPI